MRYTLLGNSGLRVSQLALGTMTFGTDWGWGAPRETAAEQLHAFDEAGGNFIDTANNYTNGTAESIIGELTASSRERFVIGTKYSLHRRDGDLNAGGNHRKNLVQSLEGSLRRLRTDYVDILWIHAWDYMTPMDEIVRALDDQVRLGKVLYVGMSDAPAWVVAYMQATSLLRGWSPFIGLQVEYSLVQRDVERELLPMARALGLGVTAWSPLGGGVLSGKYTADAADKGARRLAHLDPRSAAIAEAVTRVAVETEWPPAQVAIAWLLAQPTVIPIIGARTLDQFRVNLDAVDVSLSAETVKALDEVSHVPRGFPHDFLASQDFIHGGAIDRLDLPAGRLRVG
jgi:aryl-alcohol dehydrogenase-like predicted oxidoreductase